MPPEQSASRSCRSWSLYGFSFFSIVCAAGLVYGWPALRRNLVEEGSELSEDSLGAIFTVGAWSTQGGRFFFGLARDRWLGTRYTTCLGLLCVTGGCCGIALADVNNGVALGASMFFVGLGSAVQLCLQPVAGLFPKQMQGCLLASTSGAFQISGLVFLVLTAISMDRSKTFGVFTGALGLLIVVSAMVLPKAEFEPATNTLDESIGLSEEDDKEDKSEHWDEQGKDVDSDSAEVDGGSSVSATSDNNKCLSESNKPVSPTSMEQLKSLEYILLMLWFSVLLIPLQYYVATIGFQLEEKGDDSGVYTDVFSITYASAAAFAPLVGKIADSAGLGIAQAIATVMVAVSLFTLVGSGLDVQIFGMSCYGIGRMMVFGMFFTNVGKRFGYANYGTLAGIGLFFSAVISLIQYPLITLAAAGHEAAVNIACAVVLLCTLPYCVWLWRKERREWADEKTPETETSHEDAVEDVDDDPSRQKEGPKDKDEDIEPDEAAASTSIQPND